MWFICEYTPFDNFSRAELELDLDTYIHFSVSKLEPLMEN